MESITTMMDDPVDSIGPVGAHSPSETPETIALTPDQQVLYDSTLVALNEVSEFLKAPIPTVISVEPIRVPPEAAARTTTMPHAHRPANQESSTHSAASALLSESSVFTSTVSRGHTELLRALEVLEGLEKEEQSLVYQTSLTCFLTERLTGQVYSDARQAIASLEALGCTVPRRVCQHPFKKNDIVWVCRTCQADETCVLCHTCFSKSNHEGHDVAFYHAQAGGCCDCGDPDAWDPKGFCPRHGPDANGAGNDDDDNATGTTLPDQFVHRVRGVVPAVVDWMVQTIASAAEQAYARANPPAKRVAKERMPPPLGVARTDGDEDVLLINSNLPAIMNDILVDEYDFILEDSFPRTHHPLHRSHVFSPTAASSSLSIPQQQQQQEASVAAEALGQAGRAGQGLYLVIHADDIHSVQQLSDALKDFLGTANYFADTLLHKLVRALKLYGQLVVWGTMELIQECGINQVHLWMDGDKVATGRVGGIVLERAGRLRHHGVFCSILTREELILEQRAVAVLQWLSFVARSCDPLCLTVAECILPNRHLAPLLLADFKMSARVTKAWYSLLLTLLAVPTFKSHLAAAYCDTYRAVTAKYARGMGVLERSGYTLSVQFLNRVTYVLDLVQGRDLLGKLGKSLLETLTVATRSPYLNGRLDPNHFILTHRRYSPCISDFKCVLNVDGMARVIAARGGTFLADWISTLRLAQFMDSHVWRHWSQGHVEDESRGWVGAFNLSISLGSLFERILCWTDDATSPIAEGPLSGDLMSCVELTFHILINGIDPWQRSERLLYLSTPFDVIQLLPHTHAPASLPFSTVTARHGSALAMTQLPVSLISPFSFHLPLHRFVASCLRELCMRRDNDTGDIADLLHRLRNHTSKEQSDSLFQGLMEFPVLIMSNAAQIRAGLWRRNGSGLNDQVLNYSEPPFCRNMRDADLLMAQFATLGRTFWQSPEPRPSSDIGMAFLVNLILHRLGLFNFVGFAEAPKGNINRYLQEISDGLYPEEQKDKSNDLPLPATFVRRDSASFMLLLEEFLHFIIIFIVELPPFVSRDKEEQTQQAKLRLFREVVHRLASGPKPHSEVSEVHHVLSHWDNFLLSEDGKMVNPDDATGAALAAVLDQIANRKVSRGKMEPDKWELKPEAWETYDPAFFHISLRSHQTAAAEGRPKPPEDMNAPFGWVAKPYAPVPITAHPLFERLRRDATADVAVLSVAYRVLHLHCRGASGKSFDDLRGRMPYENAEKSETALARTIHLLTLGAYAWNQKPYTGEDWRIGGGGSVGSIFFEEPDDFVPNAGSWVKAFLLVEPHQLLDCAWYEGESNALVLLERLAVGNGMASGFVAQDSSVRSGAAWLCEFALSCCPEASEVLTPVTKTTSHSVSLDSSKNSELEMRQKAAKAKAIARMQAQAAKFSAMLEIDVGSEEESEHNATQDMSNSAPSTPGSPNRPVRKTSFGSTFSSGSSLAMGDSGNGGLPNSIDFPDVSEGDSHIPPRLLQNRPRCIICNDEDGVEGRILDRSDDDDGEGQRKKSRRRTENALGFVGYAQASVVLKGGGGPPPELSSKFSAVCEFVGTHIALCGHAVHSECCESYLASVSHREDRQIGKRDEFRCPLCQRLSNCLVPFIDAGMDWIESPSQPVGEVVKESSVCPKSDDDMEWNAERTVTPYSLSLHDYLESTPWWVTRRSRFVAWDGHSAFVDRGSPIAGEDLITVRKSSRIRSLRKKDLYQAWNAMMHTPRFVRRKLRRSISREPISEIDSRSTSLSSGEDSTGETLVWRRFMDQLSDISYRADSKRLGDDHLHDLFGEFRHYIVERYAYSTRKGLGGGESTDWPSCLFTEPLSEHKRQEMSREKLMSKLLLSIQAFTYSCCSEAFEAKRAYRKCSSVTSDVAKKSPESSLESVLSRFGLRGLVCHGKMILMPRPSPHEDSDSWPFSGRLGKLRYLGLAVMAAAGAVAADLVQLVLPFPAIEHEIDLVGVAIENPKRAPIAYPLLFGNILTHVAAAMCATCGRARARSDLLDVVWPIPFSIRGSFAFLDLDGNSKTVDSVVQDCEGFLKLGLLARILQVLLGALSSSSNFQDVVSSSWVGTLKSIISKVDEASPLLIELGWMKSCVKLLELAISNQSAVSVATKTTEPLDLSLELLQEACSLAALAAGSFLIEAGTLFQILVPGAVARYDSVPLDEFYAESRESSPLVTLQEALSFFCFESIDHMIESESIQEIVANWVDAALEHTKMSAGQDEASVALLSRLYRTQGFRVYDWPCTKPLEFSTDSIIRESSEKDTNKPRVGIQPQDEVVPSSNLLQVESIAFQNSPASMADVVRSEVSPSLLTFQSKKCISLLGGFSPDIFINSKMHARPRVCVIPTSYTDLYAELASLLPDCEQTAVCLICGEVLNAGGQGECTRHSFKCGAGAGIFFLLQECSGLILHKARAAYIHSPYVDSHGETPQYRGRPLNLDLDRYEHLREVWFSHGVRQKVLTERAMARQVILPDFY